MKNIGAWLIIAFGCLLTVGNLGAGGADVGIATVPCGGAVIVGATLPTCPVGSISVTKTVVGPGSAPAGGWMVTIGSTNCAVPGLVNRNDLVLTIPPAGGLGTVTGLYVSTDSGGGTPCQYTVTETAVAGWTPSFVPAGATYTVAAGQTTAIALTNTAVPATTTTVAATTTTVAAATTTTDAATTTVLPTTIATIATAASTAAAPPTTPTMPTAIALPATGSPSTRPTTYIGLALIALGTLILLNRRRHGHSPTD